MNPNDNIRLSYNPSPEEKGTVRYIYMDRYYKMRDAPDRQKAEKMWDKAEKAYENWREDRRKDKWQSNHVAPVTFSVIETALSEITKQNIKPIILPRGKEDEAKATIMQQIWDYTWDTSDGDLQMYNILKDALTFGTGIGQEYYWQDRRLVSSTKIGKDNKEETSEHEVLDYDDCYLEVVKLNDFFVDEKARGFTGPYAARDCVRRYIMNIDDFKLFFQGKDWNPYDNAKYVKPGGDTTYYEFYKPPRGIDQAKEVEVLWYWSTKPKDRLTIVANDVLIRNGGNPYKHKQLPFVRCLDVKRVHRFYGKGEAEILESIQDETNTLRRMIIDRNHLDIDKMFFVSRNAALSDEDLIARPHGMIPTDDLAGAKAVEYGDIPRSVELSLTHLEDDATISTGINPRAQAMPTAGTATEAAILKESTLRRIEMKIWMMKKEFLIEMARLRVANILQFYPQPKLEKIVGSENEQMYKDQMQSLESRGLIEKIGGEDHIKQYKQIRLQDSQMKVGENGQPQVSPSKGFSFFDLKPEYFVPVARGGYDIKYDASVNVDISKPLMQQKALELYDRFMQLALQVPNSYDPIKIGDYVLKKYDINPSELKPDQQGQDQQGQFLQNQIQMATMENQQMLQGQPVPATPYASPIHTRVHVQAMQAPEFQQAQDPTIAKIFTDHVVGELSAQGMRQQSGAVGTPDQTQPEQGKGQEQPKQPNVSVSVKADAMTPIGQEILKDEGVIPSAQKATQDQPQQQSGQVTQGGLSQGITNKPGGIQQPQTKNVNPALNVGGKQ